MVANGSHSPRWQDLLFLTVPFCLQDIRARGLKAQVSSLDDFDFEELPNQKVVAWHEVSFVGHGSRITKTYFCFCCLTDALSNSVCPPVTCHDLTLFSFSDKILFSAKVKVIMVVSTCGLGEFPANCKQTWMKLQSQDICKKSISTKL